MDASRDISKIGWMTFLPDCGERGPAVLSFYSVRVPITCVAMAFKKAQTCPSTRRTLVKRPEAGRPFSEAIVGFATRFGASRVGIRDWLAER